MNRIEMRNENVFVPFGIEFERDKNYMQLNLLNYYFDLQKKE